MKYSLVLICLLLLMACGGSGGGNGDNKNTQDSQDENTSPEEEASDTPEEESPPAIEDPTAMDADADGTPDEDDCDPTNPAIGPSKVEIANNGIDEDCTGKDKQVLTKITYYDDNEDGIYLAKSVTEFNEQNLPIKQTVLDPATDTPVSTLETTYNDQGESLEVKHDNNADGVIDYLTGDIYNSDNLQIESFSDFDANGIKDEQVLYTYNSKAQIVTMSFYSGPLLKRFISRTYSAQGNLIEEINQQLAPPPASTHKTIYSYDALGREIRTEMYVDLILKNSSDTTYYGDSDLVYSIGEDNDADSIHNRIRYFYYDDEGNNIKSEQDGQSFGPQVDGTVDFVAYYITTQLPDGRSQNVYETDDNNDGIMDYRETRIYSGDLTNEAEFKLHESSKDLGADGILDEMILSFFNEFGLQTRTTIDSDGDGILEALFITEYTYNE